MSVHTISDKCQCHATFYNNPDLAGYFGGGVPTAALNIAGSAKSAVAANSVGSYAQEEGQSRYS